MKSYILRAAGLVLAIASLCAPAARAQSGTIEKVEVVGLARMTQEAFNHAFGIRAGDPYDPARLRLQYKRLWDLGLFEDLSIEAEDGPGGGKVVIVKVKERSVLTSVTYQDNKVLTRTSIEDRLKEKKIPLEVGKPLNLRNVFNSQQEIRQMLGEKGYLDPAVGYKIERPTDASAAITFTIRPGAKTRIRKIRFQGNEIFSDRRLLQQLKLTRPWKWYWPLSQKSLYHPAKWDQDSGGIRDLYLDSGYLDVDLKPPVVEVKEIEKKRKEPRRGKQRKAGEPETPPATEGAPETPAAPAPGAAPASEAKAAEDDANLSQKERRRRAERERRRSEKLKKQAEREAKRKEPRVRRWAYLAVPIVEGKPYKTGTVSASGSTLFTEAQILRRIGFIKEGQTLSSAALDAAVKILQRDYQDRGYAYATARREIVRRPGVEPPVADVKFTINEDKQYTIDRIEFSGNTSTQDRVLRREFRLAEGDLFSQSLLDLSVQKLNQLGYFEAKREDVTVTPVEGQNKVQVSVPGEEKGRNEIQVGGGYSGLDGAFFTGFYSTRNLLGRGQILSASIQVGGRANRYQLAFTEPWFLGRPYTLGGSVFKRDVDYGSNQQTSGRGLGLVLAKQIGPFTSVGIRYDFEKAVSKFLTQRLDTTITEGPGGTPIITRTPVTFLDSATNRISSVSPSFAYNRVDNPYRPSRGWSLGLDFDVAGGPLGGDTNFLRPRLNYSGYMHALRRTFFGLHAEAGQIKSWQGGSTLNTANVNGIPRFQRFWLGGDTLGPRVFETRAVTPFRYVRRDSAGRIVELVKDPTGRPVSEFDLNFDGVVDRRDLLDVGGDRYFMFQGEYVVPFQNASPVEIAFFLDVANSLFEDSPWGLTDARASAGVEVRFYIPVFPVPLRLIYGAPIRKLPEDRTSAFTFSIGRSF